MLKKPCHQLQPTMYGAKNNNMIYQLTLFEEIEVEAIYQTSNIAEVEVTYRPRISPTKLPRCDNSVALFECFWNSWDLNRLNIQEHFNVMFLNYANRALGIYPLFKGAMSSVQVDVRLIFAAALKANAAKIAIAHNHPSGDLKPSDADRNVTRRIKDLAALFDIKLLDHLIISSDRLYYSFADEGLC